MKNRTMSSKMYVHYAFHCLFSTDVIEGGFSSQHLIGQDTDGPDIYEVVIGLSFKNLRADIVKSTTVGVSPFLAVDGPPEITQFADSLKIREVIHWT